MKTKPSFEWCMDKAMFEASATLSHHVKLTKTGDKGTIPNHRIFEGYSVWGYCQHLPEIGELFRVVRYRRNDVEVTGILTTTPVISHTKVVPYSDERSFVTFETANSTYRLDFLDNANQA